MLLTLGAMSLWAGIYTGNLAVAVWRSGNRTGGTGVALLALVVLLVPVSVQVSLQRM